MRAAVLHEFAAPLVLETRDRPVPEADEVLVAVEACGVCHSDLHIVEGDLPGFRAGTHPPRIPGHEVVGRVVEVGADATGLSVGQRVGVAWTHYSCGACDACLAGRENLCRHGVVTGMHVDGGYAELMRAKATHVLEVPEALDPVAAAPLFCAGVTVYRALKQAEVGPGMRVGIVGIGGLGHLGVQLARARGAEVVALDVAEDKLALGRELGAAHAFDLSGREGVKAVRGLGGLDVGVVTSAAKAAYDAALKCLKPGGTLGVVGLPAEPLTFPALTLVSLEARILGSAVGTRDDLREVLALAVAGKVHCRTETRPLDEVNAVLDAMRQGTLAGRMVLTVDGG